MLQTSKNTVLTALLCCVLLLAGCGSGSPVTPSVPASSVSITTGSLPAATVGTAYSASVVAANGVKPYTFSLTSGLLPAGFSLSPDGVLSGMPAVAGTYSFVIAVTDATALKTSTSFSLTIAPPAGTKTLSLSTATLASGSVGNPYSMAITAANGTAPYTFTLSSGAPPLGLALSSAGLLTGSPTTAGTSTFTVSVVDAGSQRASATYNLTIAAAASGSISISTMTLPAGTAGMAYTGAVLAVNGVPPYSFSVTAGAMPAGLSLASSGAITGTPTVAGTSSFTVSVVDSVSQRATATYALTIAAPAVPVSIATSTLPSAVIGAAYSATVLVTNGTAPYRYAVTSGALPSGLTFAANGVLSGAPTVAGSFPFAIAVTDANAQTATANYTLSVAPPLSFPTAVLPTGEAGVAYNATLTAANGTPPYAFSAAQSSPPAGLTLSAGGVLSGTPTAAGAFSLPVIVTDAAGQKVTTTFPITVLATVSLAAAAMPGGIVGLAYNATVSAANGKAPYSYTITSGGLPGGLALTPAGVISGTPTTAGTFNYSVTATDANTQRATQMYTVTIAPALAITTTTLPSGIVGATYSTTIQIANGTPPYSVQVNGGSLPNGLALSNAGIISGAPTSAGSLTFTITATDATSQHASATYTVTVAPALVITSAALPPGIVGASYSAALQAANGTAPYSFAVSSGSLPAGLAISGALISGTPTSVGTSTFTVRATDTGSQSATMSYTVTIAFALLLTTPALGPGQVGSAYSATFFAINGTAPYTFAVTSGSLPIGFTLAGTGLLSGTPTAAGASTFTVTATDAAGQHASANYTLTVIAPLAITTPALGSGQVGSSYSATFFAANGTAPYSFVVSGGTLPGGLTLASSGALSGTPSTAGTSSFTVTATDFAGAHASATYSITIAASNPVTLTTPALGPGQVGNSYNATFYATNGTAPYTFNVTAGALPGGFTLASSGYLSGTPTAAGTFAFTVTATDAAGKIGSGNYSLTVNSSGGSTTQPLAVTSKTLVVPVNASYNAALPITGGTTPYTVMVSAGTLPAGITLSSSGVLNGTATTTQSAAFTVSITDSSSPALTLSATFTLNVTDPSHATVQVDTTQVLATVLPGAFGMHTSVYDGQLSDTSAVGPLLTTAGISTLRYPGGSYSDRFHWAQNSLTPIYASSPGACGVLTGELYLAAHTDFGYFLKTLKAAGANALITVNYGTSVTNSTASLTNGTDGTAGRCSEPNTAGQPQEAAAWVAYANGDAASTQLIGLDAVGFNWKTVGYWASLRAASPLAVDDGYNFLRIGQTAPVGIKNWELGNEMYYNGWDGNRNFEADLHAPFIYPNGYTGGSYLSRDQVAALGPTAYGTNAIQFIQAMKAVDPTIRIGLDLSSPGVDPIDLSWNPSVMRAACAGTNFDIAIIHYYPGTYLDVKASEMLSLPQTDLPFVVGGIRTQLAQYCPANASAMKVFVTETSPNGTVDGSVPVAITGLFALHTFLTGFETGIANIDWLELHNGTFLDNSEAPGPSFYGIQLAHLLAGEGDSMVKSTSSSSTVIAHATLKANGQKGVLLINADPSKPVVVQVTVNGSSLGASGTQYTYGVATTQSVPALSGSPFAVPGNTFAVTVPAYTAIEVLIP